MDVRVRMVVIDSPSVVDIILRPFCCQ